MHKIRTALTVAALAAIATVPAAAEPSDACSNGEVPPSTTPAGVGVRQAGDPYQEPTSIYVCSRMIAPGIVWARWDAQNGRVHAIADGDSTNEITPCSDGYLATRADTTGARFYRGDDGNFSFISTERRPETFVLGLAACVIPDTR